MSTVLKQLLKWFLVWAGLVAALTLLTPLSFAECRVLCAVILILPIARKVLYAPRRR
jgi:hypothetical protein